MFWQKKKKRKKVTKPKVIAQPQQPAEETPQTAESEKKEETPLQKKPAGKKSEKVLDPEKEFLKAFKQLTNRHRSWDIWRDFIKELGDVAWYLAVSANAIGYDLETIMQMNVDKLKARYPDGFDAEHSLHRDQDDI